MSEATTHTTLMQRYSIRLEGKQNIFNALSNGQNIIAPYQYGTKAFFIQAMVYASGSTLPTQIFIGLDTGQILSNLVNTDMISDVQAAALLPDNIADLSLTTASLWWSFASPVLADVPEKLALDVYWYRMNYLALL